MNTIDAEILDVHELVDIDEFIGAVLEGEIDDLDGCLHLIIEEEFFSSKELAPSDLIDMKISEDVTHVLFKRV